MHHIEIETVWRFHKEGSPQTAVVMLGILNEIRKTGKLTSAATHAHLSYRHVWNLVEQWSEFFGVPLVETHRGKGTTLTAFGEKLVWAGERMQARLGPQLDNLAQELAPEIKDSSYDDVTYEGQSALGKDIQYNYDLNGKIVRVRFCPDEVEGSILSLELGPKE